MKNEPPPTDAVKATAEKTADIPAAANGAALAAEHWFRKYHRAGFPVIPIIPPGALLANSSLRSDLVGKIPGIMRPDGTWCGLPNWQTRKATEEDCDAWAKMGAGVGVLTGIIGQDAGEGVVVFDVDATDLDESLLIEQTILRVLGLTVGAAPKRIGRAPKFALVFRTKEHTPNDKLSFGEAPAAGESRAVEFHSKGRQFVAEGIHPVTGKPYYWVGEWKKSENLPELTRAQVEAVFDELERILPKAKRSAARGLADDGRPVDQEGLKGKEEHVRAAVFALRSTEENARDYSEYIAYGYAIKAASQDFPEVGLELWLDWCARYTGPNSSTPETAERDWGSFKPPFRRGAAWLYRQAEDWCTPDRPFSSAEPLRYLRANHLARLVERHFDVIEGEIKIPAPSPFDAPAARDDDDDVEVVRYGDFAAAYEPLDYLLEGILVCGSLYTLTARTGAGKTSWLTALTVAVAFGRQDVLGIEAKKGRIAYCTFENPDDFRMKLMGAARANGVDDQEMHPHVDIIKQNASPAKLLRTLSRRGENYALIVIDTLQASFNGNDSNSATQMVDFVREFRPMANLPGKPVVVIAAHPIKNAPKDKLVPYGSGGVVNEVDGNVCLWKEPGSDITTFSTQEKFRGFEFEPMAFRFNTHVCDDLKDAKGRMLRVPVLRRVSADAAERAEQERSDDGTALLRAMQVNPAGTQEQWGAAIGKGKGKGSVNRLLQSLEVEGLVERINRKWQITTKGKRAASIKDECRTICPDQISGGRESIFA